MATKTTFAGSEPPRVAVVAADSVVLGDLAVPCEILGGACDDRGTRLYDVRVCSERDAVASPHVELKPPYRLASLRRAHTVIVPGVSNIDGPFSQTLLSALRRAAARGARIASICTGAFVLAEAGLLDGLVATTHWKAASALAFRFPSVDVDPNVLYVDNDSVLTAAGAAAGIDLCLHLLRRDFGADAAMRAARAAVMPLERSGGQAQFIVHEAPSADGASLAEVVTWVESHLGTNLTLPAIAKRAGMSTRSLSRKFRDQLGTTPARWVTQARVRRAQTLLETTDLAVERIAHEVGFGSSSVMREHFHRVVGTSPQAYRRAFGR